MRIAYHPWDIFSGDEGDHVGDIRQPLVTRTAVTGPTEPGG